MCMCIIYTLFFQHHLQFNEVLHQRKLALHKEFVLLQSSDCDGLKPRQNGGSGVEYMRYTHIYCICTWDVLLHIITVD